MASLSSELFQRIRRVQFRTNRLVNSLFAGAYLSAFKGNGMEFDEVREYQTGDDPRNIDWNVTARMNHPYVKSFHEERELTVILMVDLSASLRFGSLDNLKSEIAAEISALLAFSAIKNQDKVGLIIYTSIIEKYIPPRKGLSHILRIIRELLAFTPKCKGTDLLGALSFLAKVQKRSAICFLLSDFLTPQEDFHELQLITKKYDLIGIHISDPRERLFPAAGLVEVCDLESGEKLLIDTAAPDFQQSLAENFDNSRKTIQEKLKRLGAGFLSIRTDSSYVEALQEYFRTRKQRQ